MNGAEWQGRDRWRMRARRPAVAVAAAAAVAVAAVAAIGGVAALLRRRRRPPVPGRRSPRELSGAPYPLTPTGRRVRPNGNARIHGPVREPAPLRALAGWVPSPPRTPLAKALAYVWALPMTLAGLLVGSVAGVRPQVREGVLLFPEARGLAGIMLRARGFGAAALGHVIIAIGQPSDGLYAHELVHVRHAERLGVLFAPLYLGLLAIYGYARHPLERAARLGGRRAQGLRG